MDNLEEKIKQILELIKPDVNRTGWYEVPEEEIDYQHDGQYDDAYEHGVDDGRTFMARAIKKILES